MSISQRPWYQKIFNRKQVDAAVVNHLLKHLWNIQNFTDFFGPLIGIIYIVRRMYDMNIVDPATDEELEAMSRV